MMQHEFETRAGLSVTVQEFEHINEVYMSSDLSKDEFCQMWVRMNRARVREYKSVQADKQKSEALKWSIVEICMKFRGACASVYESRMIDHLNKREAAAVREAGLDPEMYVWAVYGKMLAFAGLV